MAQHISATHSMQHRQQHGGHTPRRRPPQKKGLSALVVWEWIIVLGLAGGLIISLMTMTEAPDAKSQASDLVVQMKAAALGRPLGNLVLSSYPTAQRGKRESVVSIDKVPPKICVMVAWDLYRLGSITINGTAPTRVSAEKLVELCNQAAAASMTWTARVVN